MSIHKIVVSVIAAVLVVILYNLPRVVVDNDSSETGITSDPEPITAHQFQIGSDDSLKISSLLQIISDEQDNKKNAIFADSLANLYLLYSELDSATKYAAHILTLGNDKENFLLAGNIFFKAYGFAKNEGEATEYGEKAAQCFEKVLESDANDPDVRAKLAMTVVTSANPMKGIGMLREVLEEYPENETALYNLGVLSMQSGQYDKAIGRFEKLIEVSPESLQAYFYLAVSHFELGNKERAFELFNKVKLMDNDPAIIQAADGYLNEINEL